MLRMLTTPSTNRLIVHSGVVSVIGLLLITWLHIRPLGILFLLTFIFWVYKTKFDVQIMPPEELQIKVMAFVERMRTMRETNHTLFCAIACTTLGTLAIVGHLLSGSSVVLICLIIAVLLSSKYNFKILKLRRTSFNWSDRVQENEIDDFLPEVNEINMSVLERASDQSSITFTAEDGDEKSEEIPSDLLIPDCIPEIDENSTDEDDALGIGVPDVVKERKSGLSEIEFKKGHFKKDSSASTTSSSDEESLSKGLKFPDYSSVDHGSQMKKIEETLTGSFSRANPQTQSMIMTSNILPGLVSGLVSWASMSNDNRMSESLHLAQTSRVALSDDEESDFEIVNTEEYQ